MLFERKHDLLFLKVIYTYFCLINVQSCQWKQESQIMGKMLSMFEKTEWKRETRYKIQFTLQWCFKNPPEYLSWIFIAKIVTVNSCWLLLQKISIIDVWQNMPLHFACLECILNIKDKNLRDVYSIFSNFVCIGS